MEELVCTDSIKHLSTSESVRGPNIRRWRITLALVPSDC